MSVQLLDKTRKIGQLLHNNNAGKVVFNDICSVLSQILSSNVLVISRKGKVLGVCENSQVMELSEMIVYRVGDFIDPMLNERRSSIRSRSRARGSGPYLCTAPGAPMRSMTSSSRNTARQW